MSASPQFGASEPSQDERTFAVLAHVLQVVAWWIAPLVIFIMKRDSKFTSFHALQALLLQAFYMILMGVFTIFWFAGFFLVMLQMPTDKSAPPPTALFVFMPLVWLSWMGCWVAMLVISIVYGIKAGRGQWASYPLLGRLARRILKIAPDGVPPAF